MLFRKEGAYSLNEEPSAGFARMQGHMMAQLSLPVLYESKPIFRNLPEISECHNPLK
jgi:hypothetical protein